MTPTPTTSGVSSLRMASPLMGELDEIYELTKEIYELSKLGLEDMGETKSAAPEEEMLRDAAVQEGAFA